jgi:uncharacterized membrane protein YdcZ (DUF606 family)
MLVLMLLLVLAGLALLLGGPLLARLYTRGEDATGLARILQGVGILLLIAALLVRPHNPENSAFPPPPEEFIEKDR